jgi:hypothetical protein
LLYLVLFFSELNSGKVRLPNSGFQN